MHGGEHAYSTQKGPSWDYKQGPNCHEVTVLTPTLYQKASLCQRKRLEVKVRFRNEGRTLMTRVFIRVFVSSFHIQLSSIKLKMF